MSAQVEEASSAPVLIELYQHGDLTLNVGEDLNGEPTHRFRVSRHTMCMASPVWRAMLTGQFIEATKNEIPFVDDDPEALLLVLRVAHLKVHEVSRSLTLPQLINVATICDKYDTVSICQPFVGEWVQSWLLDSLTQIGQTINRHLSAGCEGWLWVAWVFGYQKQFTELANLLRISIETDATGTCFTKRGLFQTKVLIANMPPDIVGKLLLLPPPEFDLIVPVPLIAISSSDFRFCLR
jgi:hypothetical protein